MSAKFDTHVAAKILDALLSDAPTFFATTEAIESELGEKFAHLFAKRSMKQALMLDFPEVGKAYDKGLSTGKFDVSKLPYSCVIDDDLDPIRDLLSRTFSSETWHLKPSVDPSVIFFTRTILYAFKKVKMECADEVIDKTFVSFLDIDRGLRRPDLDWGDANFRENYRRLRFVDEAGDCKEGETFYRYMDYVCGSLLSFTGHNLDVLALMPKHGPGAVSDVNTRKGGDKYDFPYWPAKLQVVFDEWFFTNPRGDLQNGQRGGWVVSSRRRSSTPWARVITVPKALKGPRLITVEPTAHQYCQQALLQWIRANMHPVLRRCINFNDQEPSRDLARTASISGTLATVDLSSASDRLSCWTVERSFPNLYLLEALNACRTHEVEISEGTNQGTVIGLNKFAGMGSAVTFPIQSLVYACVCIATKMQASSMAFHKSAIEFASREVRVFGDDLIVDTTVATLLKRNLLRLELVVNEDKTHSSGHFRESCGGDYYEGWDVTPFYLTSLETVSTPAQVSTMVELSNNAHKKGLWRTASMLASLVDRKILSGIPCGRQAGGLSLWTTLRGVNSKRWRWNASLQRLEYRTVFATQETTVRPRGTESDLLQYFIERKGHSRLCFTECADDDWLPGVTVRGRSKFRNGWERPA